MLTQEKINSFLDSGVCNYAIKAYVAVGMLVSGYAEDEIRNVIGTMHYVFDEYSANSAQAVYEKILYWKG